MRNHARIRLILGLFAVSCAMLAVFASVAAAHAVVFPPEAPTGAYQKYVLRVPNERGFPTSEVSITFPAGVRVISFDEVPGWQLDAHSDDDGATFTAATWTGAVPVGRFVEFAFIGVNPGDATTLKWDVVQTYADGLEVGWTGPPDSATPASLTLVGEPPEDRASSSESGSTATWLAGVALVLALISLGLALRPAEST